MTIVKILLVTGLTVFSLNAFAVEPTVPSTEQNPFEQVINVAKDGVITAQVLAKIAMDKVVSDSKLDVITHNEVVIITGTVNSDIEKKKLISLASSTWGVKSVDISKLEIAKEEKPLADVEITTKIKTLFLKEKIMGEKNIPIMSIQVETKNGIVYLAGQAENDKQVENAAALAKSVDGVVRVISMVQVVEK